jgi:hypothetical protein
MIPIVVWYTAELSKAWSEGSLAGKAGKSRVADPYIAKNSALAKE